MTTVEWTQEPPTEAGEYWYWNSYTPKFRPRVVRIFFINDIRWAEDEGHEYEIGDIIDNAWWQPAIVPDPPLRPDTREAKNG